MAVTLEPLFTLSPCSDAADEIARNAALGAALRAAEEAGVARAWVEVEAPQVASLEVLHRCVAAGAHSAEMRLVAGALDVPDGSSWIRLAEDAASADGLLGGRLELAFESAPSAAWLARIRDAWGGAAVSLADEGEEPFHIEIHPRPARPDGPPLWVRGVSEAAARLAGELELGLAANLAAAEGAVVPASDEIARALEQATELAGVAPVAIAIRVPLRVTPQSVNEAELLVEALAKRTP